MLAKLVLEERELTAPRVWNGLWWLYRDAVRRGLAGAADPVEVRIGWDHSSRAASLCASAWWRARRHARAVAGAPTTRPIARRVSTVAPRRPRSEEGAGVSVIVSASSGPEALARCREALALQSPRASRLRPS